MRICGKLTSKSVIYFWKTMAGYLFLLLKTFCMYDFMLSRVLKSCGRPTSPLSVPWTGFPNISFHILEIFQILLVVLFLSRLNSLREMHKVGAVLIPFFSKNL